MAVKIISNYSKRLGLPGYSSHQFSVSVETELTHTDNIHSEVTKLYKTLQQAVDKEMQSTGFVPDSQYGSNEQHSSAPKHVYEAPQNGAATNKPWKASDKQRDLVFKLVENTGIEMEVVETISEEMFATADLADLNKIQMSGLIDELLSRYGKRERREIHQHARFKGRTLR